MNLVKYGSILYSFEKFNGVDSI